MGSGRDYPTRNNMNNNGKRAIEDRGYPSFGQKPHIELPIDQKRSIKVANMLKLDKKQFRGNQPPSPSSMQLKQKKLKLKSSKYIENVDLKQMKE